MPSEVHEHYDNDGTRTGYTVITRESAWDDHARGRALRLAEYERSICRCCGLPMSVAHHPGAFKVDKYTCYADKALEKVKRDDQTAAEHQNRPDGWADGLRYYVVPHDATTTTSTEED